MTAREPFDLNREASELAGKALLMRGDRVVAEIIALCRRCADEALAKAAEIAENRRDKEHNAGKFKAQVGKHDWVVQFHNGAALAASEISQEISDLKSYAGTGK